MSNSEYSVDRKVFARRRKDFMRLMDGGVMVVPTAPVRARNGDTEYPFRPDSDFYYLTGFPEPEAVAVLLPGREHGEYLVFCREKDPAKETWNGRRAGLEGAVEDYGADDAFPITDLGEILPGLLEDREKIYCNVGRYPEFDARILGWLNLIKGRTRTGVTAPYELVDLSHILHEQRLIKHRDEIKVMQRAARVAAAGHVKAMQTCEPGMTEYQVKAELEYEFQHGGSQFPAYTSIVAGGPNSCILHYIENNAELHDGDLLLIDAGAEIDCYASDLTRTFPVNGTFSAEQKEIYEIVLAAQQSALEKALPGFHWNEMHEAAVGIICQGLIDIGLLHGTVDSVIEDKSFKRFYMHRTGHWLGMDVHDVGDYKIDHEWRELEPGMAFTVEPGIYIPAADDVDQKWHNIGIRIEDDVLIQRKGHKVLTEAAPKSIEDIEALMAG